MNGLTTLALIVMDTTVPVGDNAAQIINFLADAPLKTLLIVAVVVLWRRQGQSDQAAIERMNNRIEELKTLLDECLKSNSNQ